MEGRTGEGALFKNELFYEEVFSDLKEEEKALLEFISSGNLEIDRKLEGGVPVGSLCLLEGGNDSGKSIFLQQIMWGALNQDKRVLALATEKTSKELLNQMESLKHGISDYFIIGRAKIFEINAGYVEENPQLSESLLQVLLECIKRCKEELILIDSLTIFAVNASENAVLNFFTECVKLCDNGKTILISVHGYAFSQSVLYRLRSVCSVCLELRIEQVGDQWIKTMEIQKLRGARKTRGNLLSFDVDSKFGLKIIPVSKVKA
ncbi:TPA: flagellar accessory protein FlaH [Methanosarcina acetivorans]|uniref:Flagellar accessory protein FlaH n=1 Tax=Methanosarcina acetivorans TaxID=2214 RepID=A0A832SLV6_9EURY|nr:ATPase domain-containing protein [Methanosarcina acetivorans]HIH95667.1 flagellar accessory protein FlaH [Methanosarcina acetivorans]